MRKINLEFWAVFTAMLLCSPVFLYALPEGESVVEGNATFDRSEPNVLKINTTSDKLIVEYNGFSIASNESVYFTQPSVSSAALNRVTGSNASDISGLLSANGIIYLINPNGINISPSARIDVAALVASTLNISNADFLSGKYNFYKVGGKNAFILNQGRIIVLNGGYVALLSQAVENQGTILASLGTVVLASGEKMTLALDDLNEISVVIDEGVKEAVFGPNGERILSAVKNSGTITANGGKVILTAKVLNNVFDYAINNTGIIEANSVVNHNGVIELVAEGAPIVNTGRLEAGEIKLNAKDTVFINKGKVIAGAESTVDASGKIAILANTLVQGGLISADKLVTVETDKVSVVLDGPLAIEIDPRLNTSPGVIIQAPQVKIIAKQFGTTSAPLNINAALTYINRTQGDINILDSLGIGTSILLRGPPDGFGAIVYNKDTNLTLEAKAGEITTSETALILAKTLSLIASQNINIRSNILALCGDISIVSSSGNLDIDARVEAPEGSILFRAEEGSLKTRGIITANTEQGTIIFKAARLAIGGTYAASRIEFDPEWITQTGPINLIGDTIYWSTGNIEVLYDITNTNGFIKFYADATDASNTRENDSLNLGDFIQSPTATIAASGNIVISGVNVTVYNLKSNGTISISADTNATLYVDDGYADAGYTKDFGSIRDAINAIGTVSGTSTINVAAGTYNEAVVINKSLTLLGAQANVDPRTTATVSRTAGSSAESIIDGQIVPGTKATNTIKISANNVTINGFEVKNSSEDCIYHSETSGTHSNITIKYCLVHGSGDEGIQLKIVENSLLEYNLAFDTAGDGFDIAHYSKSSTIRNNEVYDSRSDNGAIYVYRSEDMTVENNYIHNCTSSNGIKIYDPKDLGASHTTFVKHNTIINNAFTQDTEGNAIHLFFEESNSNARLTVENNIINSNTGPGELAGNGIYWEQKVTGAPTIEVLNNTITNNGGWGIKINVASGLESAVNNFTAHYNNISGNTKGGFNNTVNVTVDATKNYWGDVSGPKHLTTNPSGTGNVVSNNVDYSPWWGADYAGDPHTSSWTWYTNDSIQDAIDVASSTVQDTIRVLSGTYGENLNIDSSLILTAGSAPILDGGGKGTGITINSDNVTIDGLTIQNFNIGIDITAGLSGIVIKNNSFKTNTSYHVRANTDFDGKTLYDVYAVNGNTFDDAAVITDPPGNVTVVPSNYRVVWAHLQDAIDNDKTDPIINITAPTNNTTYDTSQTLLYTVSDNLDSTPHIDGPASGTIYNSLGTYIITIMAKDLAGNSSSQLLTFIIEASTYSQSQLSNSSVVSVILPGSTELGQYQVNTFIPGGTVYLYSPLTPTDTSAFEEFVLTWSDYSFTEDGVLTIAGREDLISFFEELAKER